MIRKLSIATLPAARRPETRLNERTFAEAFETRTNVSLLVVCVVFALFALAGYGIAELGLLN